MKVLYPFDPDPEEREVARRYAAPPWIWAALGVAVVLIALIEIPIILWALSQDVLRVQTLNGTLMVIGGLTWMILFTFIFVWPMKRMNIRLLIGSERVWAQVHNLVDRVNRTLDQNHIEEKAQKVLEEVRHAAVSLEKLEAAFCRPLKAPTGFGKPEPGAERGNSEHQRAETVGEKAE